MKLLRTLFLCLLMQAALPLPSGMAAVPALIRYQGQLANAQGVPLEGPYQLAFRLYNAEAGGTALWEEVHPAVPLSGGQFSVLLGSITSLTEEDWSASRWLSIQVNADPELSPRQQITSVPLAVRARVAEQLSGAIAPTAIAPQGESSGLDADLVDGKTSGDLLNRTNHIGLQLPTTISPQGAGSGLNADLLDSKDAAAFAASNHRHTCINRMGLPTGQTGNSFCEAEGQWCVHNLSAGGRDTQSCTTPNPGFGDWGAVCCQ